MSLLFDPNAPSFAAPIDGPHRAHSHRRHIGGWTPNEGVWGARCTTRGSAMTAASGRFCRSPSLGASVVTWLLLILLVPFRSPAASDLPSAPSRLPSTNLLVFHSRTGAVVPVKSKANWQQRRAEILRGMESVMRSEKR